MSEKLSEGLTTPTERLVELLVKLLVLVFLWIFVFATIVVFECEYGGHVIIINSLTDVTKNVVDWELIRIAGIIATSVVVILVLWGWGVHHAEVDPRMNQRYKMDEVKRFKYLTYLIGSGTI